MIPDSARNGSEMGSRGAGLAIMPNRLRVGILGVGRCWPRYSRALGQLRGLLDPVVVSDPRPGRALRIARELRCSIAEGPIDLLERDEVQAVLVLDAPWYGLWPLEQACRVSKPIFCVPSLVGDDAFADDLVERVRSARLPVMMAIPESVAPARERLSRLLTNELGAARLLRADCCVRGPRPLSADKLLGSGRFLGLLIGIDGLLSAPPLTAWACGTEAGLVTLLLDHGQGRSAQLTLWTGNHRGTQCRLEVVAAGGSATLDGTSQLRWRDTDSNQVFRRPRVDAAQAMLERFVQALRDGRFPWPGLDDAYRALLVLRAARQSLAEGRPVPIPPLDRV
jgi:myo-inositol 2-dehydrogenase / D-chiro-inositol 1-dehydrogenase